MAAWKIVDHSADVGLNVKASTLSGLFEEAVAGMFGVISETKPEGPKLRKRISLNASERESLLVDWLCELLFLFETKGFFTLSTKVELGGPERLEAQIEGVEIEGEFEGTEIKAVTHHLLDIVETREGFETNIFFDL